MLLKTLWKENNDNQHFLLSPLCFLFFLWTSSIFLASFTLLSANAFNFCSFVNEVSSSAEDQDQTTYFVQSDLVIYCQKKQPVFLYFVRVLLYHERLNSCKKNLWSVRMFFTLLSNDTTLD